MPPPSSPSLPPLILGQVPKTARGFLPPEPGLDSSGYVAARPVNVHWRKRSVEEMSEEDRAVGAWSGAGPRSIGSSSSTSMPISDSRMAGSLTPALSDGTGSPLKVCQLCLMEHLATSPMPCDGQVPVSPHHGIPISDSSYRDTIQKSLTIHSADSRCFFSLFLLLSMLQNTGEMGWGRGEATHPPVQIPYHQITGVNPMLLEAFQLKPIPSVSFW